MLKPPFYVSCPVESNSNLLSDEEVIIADIAIEPVEGVNSTASLCSIINFAPTTFPTGSLIVSRGSVPEILYHSNDLHCHPSLLLWYYTDGSDRLSLGYEPGKTRPITFEVFGGMIVDAPLLEAASTHGIDEFAYKPREELLTHPRYLETISHLVKILNLVYFGDEAKYAFLHKWQSDILPAPSSIGYANTKELFYEFESAPNPMKARYNEKRKISSTCVDLVILFLSLLHERLFINLTEQELLDGKLPKEKIFTKTQDYDLARLLRPTSDIFKLYEREVKPYFQSRRVDLRYFSPCVFFLPLIVATCFYVLFLVLFKPVMNTLYYGFGVKELFVRRQINSLSNTRNHA